MDKIDNYWADNHLFLSSNDFCNTKNEIKKIIYDSQKNIYLIYLYVYGLWGIRSLIFDINIQRYLWEIYDEEFLQYISNIIVNFIIILTRQKNIMYNSMYYYDYKNQYKYIKYWDYKPYLIIKKNNNQFILQDCNLSLKIGNELSSGIIGSYYWSLKYINNYKKISLLNYKIQ